MKYGTETYSISSPTTIISGKPTAKILNCGASLPIKAIIMFNKIATSIIGILKLTPIKNISPALLTKYLKI